MSRCPQDFGGLHSRQSNVEPPNVAVEVLGGRTAEWPDEWPDELAVAGMQRVHILDVIAACGDTFARLAANHDMFDTACRRNATFAPRAARRAGRARRAESGLTGVPRGSRSKSGEAAIQSARNNQLADCVTQTERNLTAVRRHNPTSPRTSRSCSSCSLDTPHQASRPCRQDVAPRRSPDLHREILGRPLPVPDRWPDRARYPPCRQIASQSPAGQWCERTIRPIAPNRKNAIFAGHDAMAKNWAVIASLIENCKLNAVDPHQWLTKTLTAIARGHMQSNIADLMRWNYTAKV